MGLADYWRRYCLTVECFVSGKAARPALDIFINMGPELQKLASQGFTAARSFVGSY